MSSKLSDKQFTNTKRVRNVKKDPNDTDKADHGEGGKPKFSGGDGSKTMRIPGGKLPPPQKKHVHHKRNARRSRRAK